MRFNEMKSIIAGVMPPLLEHIASSINTRFAPLSKRQETTDALLADQDGRIERLEKQIAELVKND